MSNHARLDHDPTRRRPERQGQRRGTTSSKAGTATSLLPAKPPTRVSGFPGGPHDLTNEALWSRCSTPFVADAAGTDPQLIVARFHWDIQALGVSDGAMGIDCFQVSEKARAGDFMRGPISPTAPAITARRRSALLSRNLLLISPCPHCPTSERAISRDTAR